MPPPESNRQPRDPRADFFRGLAMMVIAYDHLLLTDRLPAPTAIKITPIFWGLTDAAAAFIFISGFVYAIAYGKLAAKKGWAAVTVKSWRRAVTLWFANLALFASLWAALHVMDRLGVPPTERLAHLQNYENEYGNFGVLGAFARFQLNFFCADILPLYMTLIAVAPLILWGLGRWPRVTLGISVVLFGATQFGLIIPWKKFGIAELYFNPLAWQVFFVGGMALQFWPQRFRPHRFVVVAAGVMVAAVAVVKWLIPLGAEVGLPIAADALSVPDAWRERENLPAVRVVYFAALTVLVLAVSPRAARFWQTGLARAIMTIGRHSLLTFCFGVFATLVGVTILAACGLGWVAALVAFVPIALATWAVGALADRWQPARGVSTGTLTPPVVVSPDNQVVLK